MLNPKEILVTTTSTLQNIEVKQYLKPISAQIVVGAGFLSDFAASFTDLFGGRSATYQRRLAALYDEAIAKLKREAYEIGANCIMGLNIDMDEISGKGKEMFMITAIGTAVIIDDHNKNIYLQPTDKLENVSLDKLHTLKTKRKIIADANNEYSYLTDEIWDFLISNQVYEIFDFIILQLRKNIDFDEAINKLFKNTIDLLNSLPEEKKSRLLYDSIVKEENEKLALKLCGMVGSLQLLDFDYVAYILQLQEFEKQKKALVLILCNKPFYNKEDIGRFKSFITLIKEKFPERGTRSMKKGLLSSRGKEVWACECGKTNDIGVNCYGCEKDI